MKSIPTKKDFIVFNCLDEQSAVRTFLGKDLIEANSLFEEDFLSYQEHLMWMGPKAFEYYVIAAINYLKSMEIDKDDEIEFETFCSLIEHRIESENSFKALAKNVLKEPIKEFLNLEVSDKIKIRLYNILKELNV